MASLESGVGYFPLDTAETGNVPEHQNCAKQRAHTYTRHDPVLQRMLDTGCKVDWGAENKWSNADWRTYVANPHR